MTDEGMFVLSSLAASVMRWAFPNADVAPRSEILIVVNLSQDARREAAQSCQATGIAAVHSEVVGLSWMVGRETPSHRGPSHRSKLDRSD